MSKHLPEEKVREIILLNEKGLPNTIIAKQLDINKKTVAHYLNVNGKKSKFSFEQKSLDRISDTEARCNRCGKIKILEEFNRRSHPKCDAPVYSSFCRSCKVIEDNLKINNDINKYLAHTFRNLKSRAKINNIPFNLTKEYIVKLYEKQNGNCFYTDLPMICKLGSGRSREGLSVDKIVPQLGYTEGNVVLCQTRINTCKSDLSLIEVKKWMPPFFNKIIEHYRTKLRVEVGDVLSVSDFARKQLFGIENDTLFIVVEIKPDEKYYVNGRRPYYTDVYLKDVSKLGDEAATIYGPVSEPQLCYHWQLGPVSQI